MEQNVALMSATANEFLDGRKRGFGRAAKDEVTIVMISQGAYQVVARIAAIKEQDCPRTDRCHQAEGLFTLGAVNADHCSGHRNAPKHVIGRCDQTLGIVPLAFMVETALRVELQAVLRCCGQVVLGAIDTYDGHTMPKVRWISRPKPVGQIHGVIEDVAKHNPWKLLARPAEGAAVNCLGIGPESAAACIFEKLTGFDINPFVLAAGTKGQDKGDQLLKGELAQAREIFR